MSILITGSEGFVGRNLVESFLDRGYDLLFPTRAELDLTDPRHVTDYFKTDSKIETIVHCANVLREGTSYPVNTCEKNLKMFFNLQKQMSPSMKMITLGSGSEYDRKHWQRKMTETFFDTHVPEDSHSYAKYLISKYIIDTRPKNIACFRLFGIFGKYEDYRYKFISNAIVKNLLGMPIVINQNVIYDYIYITDFIRIVEYYVNHRAREKTYNITPRKPIDLLTIAELINRVAEKKSDIRLLNPGIGIEYSGDNSKLMKEIGDFQFTSYETAIAELYAYYGERIDILDADAIEKDVYLNYAKSLKRNYFRPEK